MALTHSPAIITEGLVLHLDAGNPRSYPRSGTAWRDLSRRGNDGTLTNGPTFSAANGGGIVFDGINDNITVTSNPVLTNQITVEVWVNLLSTTPNQTGWILGRESSYRMLYSSTDFQWICATTNNGWYTSGTFIVTPQLNALQTYHVVGTFDGSNNRIYLNGVLVGTASNISGNILNIGTYYLIRSVAANVDFGKGSLYMHRLYNRALSGGEIAQNFNATRGRFGV